MPRIHAETVADFTGGLNLSPDTFKHARNETPDCLNVDISPRGGFELRGAFVDITDNGDVLTSYINTMWTFSPDASTSRVMVCTANSGRVFYYSGTTWTGVPSAIVGQPAFGADAKVRTVVFKNRLYMVGGDVDPWRWDGVAANNAFQFAAFAFNNDLENPTAVASNGKFPRASLACSWMGSVWVADTWESGVRQRNRVRWSHPNFPEDWRADDFIDIDPGKDHDGITALVPLDDRLLVFKRSSVHVIYGSPPESLSTRPLTYEAGCLTQDACVATDMGCYFYDPIQGVFLIDEKGLNWVWENIHPAMLDGRISFSDADEVMLGWGNRRLWVSLPFGASTVRSDIFILDPSIKPRKGSPGAWTRYNARRPVGPFVEHEPPGAPYRFLAATRGGGSEADVVACDQRQVSADGFVTLDADGGFHTHIDSHFMTPWIDLNEAAADKRWKRPQFVLKSGINATILVDGFMNYNGATVRRHFSIAANGYSDVLQWGPTGGAENFWGSNLWAPSGDQLNQIEQGSPLGTARSVALRFNGPLENVDWGVNQISFRYIPRKIRNS